MIGGTTISVDYGRSIAPIQVHNAQHAWDMLVDAGVGVHAVHGGRTYRCVLHLRAHAKRSAGTGMGNRSGFSPTSGVPSSVSIPEGRTSREQTRR